MPQNAGDFSAVATSVTLMRKPNLHSTHAKSKDTELFSESVGGWLDSLFSGLLEMTFDPSLYLKRECWNDRISSDPGAMNLQSGHQEGTSSLSSINKAFSIWQKGNCHSFQGHKASCLTSTIPGGFSAESYQSGKKLTYLPTANSASKEYNERKSWWYYVISKTLYNKCWDSRPHTIHPMLCRK